MTFWGGDNDFCEQIRVYLKGKQKPIGNSRREGGYSTKFS